MINPSSSAFVSEQLMDPKPPKKQNRNKNKNPPYFSPYSPRTPLSSPNSRTPRWGATLLHRARAQEFSRFPLSAFFPPSFLRFRSFPVETGIPTYLPTHLHTYRTYIRTSLPCVLYSFSMISTLLDEKMDLTRTKTDFSRTYFLTNYYSWSAQIIRSTQINS